MIHRNIYLRIIFSILFLFSGFLLANSAFLPHWAPIFMLGIAYVSYIYKKQSLIEFVIWQVLSVAMIVYAFDFTILCFCISTLLIIHFLPAFKTKLTLFFGHISYSLYLLHGLTGGFVINYLSHIFRSPWQQCFVILFGFAIATFASYLFYRVIEKPSQKWSKSITL
jgi:peptidoglycan/LPS O-acetylase OafA/YrhL